MPTRSRRIGFAVLLVALLTASDVLAQETKPAAADPAQIARETRFGKQLSGAAFVGRYTDSNEPPGALPKEDRYTISKVSKIQGDLWLFQARIQYGDRDVTVPLPLKVLWAGDTPVITLDNMPVPGLGTFNARVVIHGDQYAGTWSGADHGGFLFGRIEKTLEPNNENAADPPAKNSTPRGERAR